MNETKKIQIRSGFSDRMKIQPLNTKMQITEFDERTRIAIANLVVYWYLQNYFSNYQQLIGESIVKDVFNQFLSNDLKLLIKYGQADFVEEYFRIPIMEGTYDEVLSYVEYLSNLFKNICQSLRTNSFYSDQLDRLDFDESLNVLFQQEFVGYRIIDGMITPISDEIEVDEINDVLANKYEGCRSHIHKSLLFLSDRENPDYKNSIKESISAVESICQIIVGEENATLGRALKKLESKGIFLHESLREAYIKLYGYASDQGGIRHAEGTSVSNVSFEEAKYMLVSCCAFVNFLIAEDGKNEK